MSILDSRPVATGLLLLHPPRPGAEAMAWALYLLSAPSAVWFAGIGAESAAAAAALPLAIRFVTRAGRSTDLAPPLNRRPRPGRPGP